MNTLDILLVEDNDMVAQSLLEMLSVAGYRVARARDADEGWALFQEHRPRALIADHTLQPAKTSSRRNGLDLATSIREVSPETPVLLLSAAPPAHALTVCNAVLLKPVRMADLVAALEKVGVSSRG